MRATITVAVLAVTLTLFGATAAHADPLPPGILLPDISIPEIKLPEIKLPTIPGT
ncbi:hypothetical protein [Streptomyces longispororuber]|nr:hypothetical protein [Streptomyces longispororuber]